MVLNPTMTLQVILEDQAISPPSLLKVVAVEATYRHQTLMENLVDLVVVVLAQLPVIRGELVVGIHQEIQLQHKDIMVLQDILDHTALMDILPVVAVVQVVLVQQEIVQRLLDLEELERHLLLQDLLLIELVAEVVHLVMNQVNQMELPDQEEQVVVETVAHKA